MILFDPSHLTWDNNPLEELFTASLSSSWAEARSGILSEFLTQTQNCSSSPRFDLNHCRATCRDTWDGQEPPENLILHGGPEDIWVDQFGIKVAEVTQSTKLWESLLHSLPIPTSWLAFFHYLHQLIIRPPTHKYKPTLPESIFQLEELQF